MNRLSLDDFEWVEEGFDKWNLVHKTHEFKIAVLNTFNGWHVQVLYDESQRNPIHVDSFDAAQAIAQITAVQYMEEYHEQFRARSFSRRVKKDGPPGFRTGVFKVE